MNAKHTRVLLPTPTIRASVALWVGGALLAWAAMVVHDLKNPTLAIDMASRVLLGPKVSEDDRRFYLEGIREETMHVQGIVRDLTDDVQVLNGRFSLRKADVDLSTLVTRLAELQRKTFQTHRIEVRVDGGCRVNGDANRIERVITNLVSNAVKYSPANTCVTLRVEKTGSHAVLTISDQGPGITEEDLKVLFQPFGRGRSADSLAEGTGLGLYVVNQIVEAHNGQIDVYNTPGQGATFEVRLPLTQVR
jgi:signal transduction histidine kinase